MTMGRPRRLPNELQTAGALRALRLSFAGQGFGLNGRVLRPACALGNDRGFFCLDQAEPIDAVLRSYMLS
jgi:hypothetical protein